MTSNRYTQIGLDRIIRLAWLEKTVSLMLDGNDRKAIKTALQHDLQDFFQSPTAVERGSLDKTMTILMKVWFAVSTELEPLHAQGLELLKRLPSQEHLPLHWGMMMAAYPFWAAVAIQTGRLLKLQANVAAAHIQRRVREQYGERQTVSRATQRVLRSYVDWGVLIESSGKGLYGAGVPIPIDNSQVTAWLVEASLCARPNGSASLRDLFNSPSLFPFQIKPIPAEHLVAASPRLDLLRHGLDDELIMLKRPPL